MISKKCFIIAMVTLMSILTLTGCSTMLKNPMKYILSQDETRQDNADKDNETTSETVDDNKEDRKSTRLNSSHSRASRMPSSA